MNRKTEFRRQLKIEISSLSPEERERQSTFLCEKLLNMPELQNTARLGIYLPLPDEPDVRPALASLLQNKTALYLPFPEAEGSWRFRRISSLQSRETGPWNLDLPASGEAISPQELGIILVPGRGFTMEGDRIGRGKGIYDQLLLHTSVKKIGVAFNCQLVNELPSEPHDIQVDEVWIAE